VDGATGRLDATAADSLSAQHGRLFSLLPTNYQLPTKKPLAFVAAIWDNTHPLQEDQF
jgi:hypothetical protein